MSMVKDELLMVCGEREYDLLYKNGTSVVDKGKREVEEKDIPKDFDYVDPADGSLVRTLDAFCLCDMNGVPVKIEDVFEKKDVKIQAFGTVIRPKDCEYDTEDATKGKDSAFQKVQKEKRKKQKRLRVWIPSIVDWCFDYAIGGNSKLWLVSESGAWYKIATLRGGRNFLPEPSRSFRRYFTSTRLKFEACAFTWEALIVFSSHKGQPAFQDVMREILALAQWRGNPMRPVLEETVVMCEHAFVSKQLKDVDCGGNSKRRERFLDVLSRRGEKVLRKSEESNKMMDDLDLLEMQRSLGEPVIPIWKPDSNSSWLFQDANLTTKALSVWGFLRKCSSAKREN